MTDPTVDRPEDGRDRPEDRREDESDDRPQGDQPEGTVSESAANPVPPATETLTSEDTHDTPQSPTRLDED